MKASGIFVFILTVFLWLGAGWLLFPPQGWTIGPLTLRFPTPQSYAGQAGSDVIDVEDVLEKLDRSFDYPTSAQTLLAYPAGHFPVWTAEDRSETQRSVPGSMLYAAGFVDSLQSFADFLRTNPNRICLPHDDYRFLDPVFEAFEHAADQGYTCRVLYYGDSQLELDRITSTLRQALQERFGGSGPSMIPVIQPVPTVSVVQRASEDMTRYAVYGDSTVARAAHRRYGIMAQFAVISGTGSMTFQSSRHTLAEERVKTISAVSLLVGQCSPDFAVTLQTSDFTNRKTYADIRKEMLQRSDAPADSTSVPTVCLVQWKRPRPIRQGTLLFEGQAEIYAVMLDGDAGVAVDNVALRGCSGTIFTQIDRTVMTASFRLLRVPLIVLQFGGNYMPSIHSTSDISGYMRLLCRQIAYFRTVAPDARLLFVGPSDMGQSRQGKIETWENLPALNDSLKRVMLSQDVAYWDMFHVMGGKNSMKQWVEHDPPLAVSDYIHFTSAGAQWMGRGLSRSLLAYYDFYRMRKQLDADFLDDTIRKGEEDDHE